MCDTVVCDNLYVTKLCGSVEVREEEVHAGYRSKNKSPTQFCGERFRSFGELLRFLTLSSSNIEEVSQNCFVLDVVKLKNWRKSRRIAASLVL